MIPHPGIPRPGPGVAGSRPRSSGFTLIELLISSALMALVLGAAYACLQAGLAARRTVEPRSDRFQAARVALSLLAADIRSACPMHKGPEFLGANRDLGGTSMGNLDFATHHYTPRREGEGDYACVSWFVEPDPATGERVLWRRRNPGLANDPLSGGRREEILRPVEALDLEFYDGLDWHTTWGDPNGRARQENSFRTRPNLVGMPKAVRITLSLPGEALRGSPRQADSGTNAAPITFGAMVKVELDSAEPSSGGGSSPSTSSPAPGANPGSTPFGP